MLHKWRIEEPVDVADVLSRPDVPDRIRDSVRLAAFDPSSAVADLSECYRRMQERIIIELVALDESSGEQSRRWALMDRQTLQNQLGQILAGIEAQDFRRADAGLRFLCRDLDETCRPLVAPGEARITWVPEIALYRLARLAVQAAHEKAMAGDWAKAEKQIRMFVKRLPTLRG